MHTYKLLIVLVGIVLGGIAILVRRMVLEIKRECETMKTVAFFLLSASLGFLSFNLPMLVIELGKYKVETLFPLLLVIFLLFVSGFIMGFLNPRHPVLWGVATMAFFPFITIIEGIIEPGSHHMLPFEFISFLPFMGPGVLGARIGERLRKRKISNVNLNKCIIYLNSNLKKIVSVVLFLVVILFWYSKNIPANKKQCLQTTFKPDILTGENFISKSIFVESKKIGRVRDIVKGELNSKPGAEIGIAWDAYNQNGGAVFCDEKGEIKSTIAFRQKANKPKIVDVEQDGICEFLSRGGWAGNVILFNHSGKTVWFYQRGKRAVNYTASGDIDGDGELEFALSFNGSGGVRLLDSNGELIWKKKDSNARHVEIADINQDGNLEIISSNSRGSIKIRDKDGNILSDVKPAIYFSKFAICRWPSSKDREYIITSRKDEKVYILDFNGKTIAKYNAPKTLTTRNICAASVRLIKGKPHYLAVLIMLRASWHRSILYLYDEQDNIVYQEIIPDMCKSMCVLETDRSGSQKILIGGTGKVWQYEYRENRE